MIKLSELKELATLQKEQILRKDNGLQRNLSELYPVAGQSFAFVISGIRRCGKSTVIHQIINKDRGPSFYLNFDTPKLYNFSGNHFDILDKVIESSGAEYLFFDEIQVVEAWEIFVRQKLDEGFFVTITGSNASLLSKELGTKLTGRHVSKELFPFSFFEYCQYKNIPKNVSALEAYMENGGMPEFIKTGMTDILTALIDDILYRDIVVRHKVRDVKSLKQVFLFLASNAGKLMSATGIRKMTDLRSTATVLEYLSFFEDSYLMFFVPKFAYSLKVQMVNPKKNYFIDVGVLNVVSMFFGKNFGRKLENMVFLELRRQYTDIYYFEEDGKECDFVVVKGGKPALLIQVCFDLNADNEEREINGLSAAMKYFDISGGYIITFDQEDIIMHQDKKIECVPFYQWVTT